LAAEERDFGGLDFTDDQRAKHGLFPALAGTSRTEIFDHEPVAGLFDDFLVFDQHLLGFDMGHGRNVHLLAAFLAVPTLATARIALLAGARHAEVLAFARVSHFFDFFGLADHAADFLALAATTTVRTMAAEGIESHGANGREHEAGHQRVE
jgi:hypothetical protein